MAKKAQNQEEMTPMGCALTVLVVGGIMLWSGTKLWGAIVLAVGDGNYYEPDGETANTGGH